jgi:hypothetical protein
VPDLTWKQTLDTFSCIATAAVNVFLGHTRAPGRLEPLRFDGPEEDMRTWTTSSTCAGTW